MRDVITELKALRLHGMAATWVELGEQNSAELQRSRWLIEHMLEAEASDRATRSVSHQMATAKFPVHPDLAGFDFEVSPLDRKLVATLASCEFTAAAHNAVLVGGPGTGKSYALTAAPRDIPATPSARRSTSASRSTSAGARPSAASARRCTAGSSGSISTSSSR